jgi:hypothetical protein
MFREYYEQMMAQERERDLERWLALERRIRESRRQEDGQAPRPGSRLAAGLRRLRVGLGTLLLRLGSALIGCEERALALLERRTLKELP